MYGLIKEQRVTLPTTVTDSYSAKNCDQLHAFQGTNGKVIGNMNVTVGNKLQEIYNGGINPKVSKVKVEVNGMTVTWTVTIDKSNDGKAWVGFTSRGAGCNDDIINRAVSASYGNDSETAKTNIKSTYGEQDIEIEIVNDFIYSGATAGKNSFRQVFYRYTKPINNPPKGYQQQTTTVTNKPSSQNQQTPPIHQQTLTFKNPVLSELKNTIKEKTKNLSVDLNSSSLDLTGDTDNITVTIKPGNQKVIYFSMIWSNASEDELYDVYSKVKNATNDYITKSVGNIKTAKFPDTDGVVKDFWVQLIVFLPK